LWSSLYCPQSLVISCTVRSLWSSPVLSAVSGHLLYCVCSPLVQNFLVWLSDFHSLKFWLFVSNLFATPALYNDSFPVGIAQVALDSDPNTSELIPIQ
ncbi:unnamed protein product, partial [Staurois parvus]